MNRDDGRPDGGCCVLPAGAVPVAAIAETAHPAFAGVYLKTLVPGRETGGAVSVHRVRVEPGCRLDGHVHAEQWEVHEVAAGEGVAVIDGRETVYRPGVSALIPKGRRHEVRAGEKGLLLTATFAPAAG